MPHDSTQPRRGCAWRNILVLTGLLALGCGNSLYVIHANSATARLEEARELGAEKLAAYEYYFAKQHLEKASSEAAEADYGDAIALAETAEDYATKAVRLAKAAHRGGGR